MPKIRLFCMMIFVAVVGAVFAQDAPQNLLENGGFESPYEDVGDAVLSRDVALGWTPWNLAADAEYPIFEPASLNSPDRILEGEDAQKYVAFLYTEFNAGVYQVVSGLQPGEYTFSVNAYVWSSDDETQRDVSAQPCGTTVEVGIDPTGSEDPAGETIVWSEPVEACDEYTEHSVTAQVEGETAAVFVRTVANETRVLTEVYLDEAVLTTGAEVVGTDEIGGDLDVTEEAVDEVATEDTGGEAGLETVEAPVDTVTEESDLGILTQTQEVTPEAPLLTEEAVVVFTATVETLEVPVVTEEPLPTEEAVVLTAEALPTEEATLALPTDDPGLTQTADANLLGTNAALVATANAGLAAETAAAANNQATQDTNATAVMGTATTLAQTQVAVDAQGTSDAGVTAPTEVAAITATIVPASPTFTLTPESPQSEVTAPVITETAEPQGTEETEREIPFSEAFPSQILHTVQYGDTVSRLAALYGSATQAIIEANGLNENALIYVGQGLVIPVRTPPVPTATATPAATNVPTQTPTEGIYVVQLGDTLSQIARRFNTTVRTLAQLNGIVNVNIIEVGQRLQLPGGGGETPPPATQVAPTAIPAETAYTVQPGDSLYRIAVQYRVTIAQLAEINQIENRNLIFVGQRLVIPQSES